MAKWSDYTKQGSDYNRDRTVQDVPEETPVQEQQYPVEQEMPGYDWAGNPAQEQPQEEPYRIYDAHYSPQWVLDEKQNRLNPDYVSEITDDVMSKEEFDSMMEASLADAKAGKAVPLDEAVESIRKEIKP